jgi:hypothetical protein
VLFSDTKMSNLPCITNGRITYFDIEGTHRRKITECWYDRNLKRMVFFFKGDLESNDYLLVWNVSDLEIDERQYRQYITSYQ